MDVFIRYKEIKKRLVEGAVFSEEFSEVFDSVAIDCPALWYTGQYQTAKDNVSVVCPVVYIEMQRQLK